MNKILNFRKLANGKKNLEGKSIVNIYRSADVSFADESDITNLNQLNIKNIIDLRSSAEISSHPQLNVEGIVIEHVDIIGDGKQNEVERFEPSQLYDFMVELYGTAFITTDGFKAELESISRLDGAPFLFHCTAGKDRTGITGAILMYILGFTKQQIIEEYLTIDLALVDSIYERFIEELDSQVVVENEANLRAIASVKREFIESFFNGVEREYGELENFISEKLEIKAEERQLLIKNYLV